MGRLGQMRDDGLLLRDGQALEGHHKLVANSIELKSRMITVQPIRRRDGLLRWCGLLSGGFIQPGQFKQRGVTTVVNEDKPKGI